MSSGRIEVWMTVNGPQTITIRLAFKIALIAFCSWRVGFAEACKKDGEVGVSAEESSGMKRVIR